MLLDGQAPADLPSHARRSFLRSSLVWKLTLFVGVLVAFTCAVLSGVAYVATSRILVDQIHNRLLTVASDRQEMLAYTLGAARAQRATRFASRGPLHRLMTQRAEDPISAQTFGTEA